MDPQTIVGLIVFGGLAALVLAVVEMFFVWELVNRILQHRIELEKLRNEREKRSESWDRTTLDRSANQTSAPKRNAIS